MICYTYDAWGKPINKTGTLASTLGTIQPFRYRGYVFDEETGLYYLQTRYYDLENVRFLNADIYVSTGRGLLDSNMFAYQDDYSDNPGIGGSTAAVEDAVFYGLSLSMDEDVSQILESFWGHFKYLVNQFVEALEE